MKCKVARKEKHNLWAIGNATFYIIHRDQYDHPDVSIPFSKLKVGDEIVDPDFWYSARIGDLQKAIKGIKVKKNRDYSEPSIFLSNPKKVKYKTWNFGGLPDGTIVNAYVIASKGGQYMIYCAKDCFFDGNIDSGTGSVTICIKRNGYYVTKYKNDMIIRGWKNVGEEIICDFVSDFLNGDIGRSDWYEELKKIWCKESQLLSLFKKLDAIELKEAKKQKAEYGNKNRSN